MIKFRKIKSLKFLYEVSNDGKVRNIKSKKVLKPHLDRYGYHQYVFNSKLTSGIHMFEHQCVMEAWGPSKPDWADQIDHIDRNKLNNHIDNLRWVDVLMNMSNRNNDHCSVIGNKYKHKLIEYTDSIKEEVIMFDKDWNELRRFEHARLAAEYVKTHHTEYSGSVKTMRNTIRRAAKQTNTKYAYKYRWKILSENL